MNLAPIVIFVYNRPDHTQKTIESVLENKESSRSDLIVYSDGARDDSAKKKVQLTREYVQSIHGFKSIEIIEREQNIGLAASIISGVSEVLNRYDRVIVLEDDMLVSRYFLQYMNEALELYEHDDRVISIHGYNYPVQKKLPEAFFIKGSDCWGWATWKRGWKLFNADGKTLLLKLKEKKLLKRFDFFGAFGYAKMLRDQIKGKNQSWAIRWYASALLSDKLTLYPGKTMVQNFGLDGSGTHFDSKKGGSGLLDIPVSQKPVNLDSVMVKEDEDALLAMSDVLRKMRPSILKKILRRLRLLLKK